MKEAHSYEEGDWIVHSRYGVGQIKGVEVKSVSGQQTRYYRIKTADSTFWMPVDQIDNSEMLRPLSTAEEIQQAIVTLGSPPKEMSSNYKARQNRIERVRHQKTPKAMARLIRDLRARRREKGPLNQTERSALRALRQRLAEEWAIVTGIKTEKAVSKLDELLDPQEHIDNDPETAGFQAIMKERNAYRSQIREPKSRRTSASKWRR